MADQATLIRVFRDTEEMLETDETLRRAALLSKRATVFYPEQIAIPVPCNPGYDTAVTLSHDRTFAAAMRLRREYPDARIAVHNFASATNPGGGVVSGARAQEECLCRCSTLYPALNSSHLRGYYYEFHRNRHDVRYTDTVLYTPEVIIFKTDEDIPQLMPKSDWCKVGVITCAAPNLRSKPVNPMNPGTGSSIRMSDEALRELHLSRGRRILQAAAAQCNEVLVLGAFGCGAFRNNPDVVAAVYKELTEEFRGYFRHIEFAVYTPKENPENYFAFERVLQK